ncbi:Tim17-domain-containing protein [Auriculariales sp. MPI-PUGE-AT-0066]|nr:Tim17-domain-containing protein [Auriculariales sp. MPI-PUGE-AT-0066]
MSSSDSPSATDTLRAATWATGSPSSSAAPADRPQTASEVLGAGGFDPSRLHPMAQIGDKLDYLLLDDAKISELPGASTALPSRGWSDDLCYGTGTTYLSGLVLGGVWGLREGMRRPLGVGGARLRLNAVLNAMTRRGSWMANSGGILALVYNGINSSVDAYRGHHDVYGGMAAGAISGALYKCTSGVRPMLISSIIMTSAAGGWSYVKHSML